MSRIDFVTGAPERYIGEVRALATVPDRLREVLSGQAVEDLRRVPSETEWPPVRVLAHLLSYARHTGEFIYRIAWMQEPLLVTWDEAEEVEREGWDRLEGAELFARIRAEIEETVALLSVTPDASWGRPGLHPVWGRRSLRQQVRTHVHHLEEHIAQIERVLAARPVPEDVAGRR